MKHTEFPITKNFSTKIDLEKIDKRATKYTLKKGTDNLSFFFDKGKWLGRRFTQLLDEITKRGLAEFLNTD